MGSEKMKVIVTSTGLGTREISSMKDLIEDQLAQLKLWRDDGRIPSQRLLDDIRVYEFILSSDDPEKFARSYLEAKRRLGTQDKLKAVRSLGWPL